MGVGLKTRRLLRYKIILQVAIRLNMRFDPTCSLRLNMAYHEAV